MSEATTAGAKISGSYFGDKLSPLSDTTNLTPAVIGTDIYKHIRHMLWTTIPSMIIALIIFTLMGLSATGEANLSIKEETISIIEKHCSVSLWLLFPVADVIVGALFKMRPFPVILMGASIGGIFAIIFQPNRIVKFIDMPDMSKPVVVRVCGKQCIPDLQLPPDMRQSTSL